MIKTGSDFSGVGAFEQALMRLGIKHETVFSCDMDKFARQTFIHNYGEPKYYPENVYDREIPVEPLDVFMTSPPCQAFSLAGKRKGEDDERGILFYNSHEFIQQNKPRYFIFENVKGLLSDDNGRTFNVWLEHLGGKSVNGNPVIFPIGNATPYHIYWKVLNAKDYNIPQNRERVFIVGIRDDQDNNFSWPKPIPLEKRLKDVLEDEVDEKYFLSDKMLGYLEGNSETQKKKGNGFKFDPVDGNSIGKAVTTKEGQRMDDNFIKVKSATKQGYEIATEGDSINLAHPNSETRRGRVGKSVAQTLETSCNQGVIINPLKDKTQYGWHFEQAVYNSDGIIRSIKSTEGSGNKPKVIIEPKIGAFRGRNIEKTTDRTTGAPTEQRLEINHSGTSNTITSVQKDNVVVIGETTNDRIFGWHENENVVGAHRGDKKRSSVSEHIYHKKTGICTTIQTAHQPKLIDYKIRRLTPRECANLMDFPQTFTWTVSDTQIYKQMGNSIVVAVLAAIIDKLNLK